MSISRIVFSIFALFISAVAAAGQGVSLPLDGYYRPGRYFPVRVELPRSDNFIIYADGAIRTVIGKQRTLPLLVPVLSTGAALGPVHIGNRVASSKPQPLETHDSLVGVAGGVETEIVARAMFPGTKIVIVHLDPADPLPGPPIAWQSLDGIVLAERWPGGLNLEHLPQWLSGGMTVGVAAGDAPDHKLPWRPISGGWVLLPNLAGPLGCDGNEDAYAPSMTWHPDLRVDARWRIVGWAMVIILALLLATLLPRRVNYGMFGAVAIFGIVLPARPTESFRATGEIEVARSGWEQRDRWTYFAGPPKRTMQIDVEEGWPIFHDPAQAARLNCSLTSDGLQTTMQFTLPADNRLAFMQREIRPAASVTAGTIDDRSPMSRLARLLYRDAGEPHILSNEKVMTDDPTPTWPTVTCTTK